MPRVSVIIPTHRRPILLAAAIQSVFDQTFQDFEIVVVDDASGDNTEQVVAAVPRSAHPVHLPSDQLAGRRGAQHGSVELVRAPDRLSRRRRRVASDEARAPGRHPGSMRRR